ncbi:Uncharacterized protein PECH_008272 [Penicillium ucsense]|uniref:Cell cycle control protein n=1 Tax=Penicillium ucsense TaxID=2839758 RepID=A0A8J8WJL5_9EURO|nr:Uncharacterized protein PECM_007488 [Penicillium ucsense]KAF7734328.1 Uncharacterized protein PECH_008272 [Penicillium ucsense]
MSPTEEPRPESIDEQERARAAEGDKKTKSRKPANTAFRQQRLKAWQPILTPKSVLPLFFIVGIVFAPIGGVLLWANSQIQEIVIDYSRCSTDAPVTTRADISDKVSATFKSSTANSKYYWQRSQTENGTMCSLFFTIPEAMGPPVYMYYRLTNFYQNHRRYVQSLDLDQLKGKAVSSDTIKGGTCSPLDVNSAGIPYYPCGLIANSVFNDTINTPVRLAENNHTYVMTKEGIAWNSDKELVKKTEYKPGEVVPPPNWSSYNGTYEKTGIPNLQEDQDLMVWMRTAGLPNFSKMSRRNDTTAMEAGDYRLDIIDRFPVTEYDGTKSILISTRTVMGGKNPFMGIAYVVVGGVCVLLGALFTVAYLIRPRKLGDHTYLTWDATNQPASAVASGRDDRMRANA